ncbi:MAG: FKBP-type peptidyl-prolyl cis-trans isomerase [Bacteroidales bacterium]|nr:FKBP-type peptidyl-prolyl cis-trans isomerase [Clostridium sp.]MCM1204499.1 FKBP-type peptidyl-prolyl cis-trans isomerase [Bacteroidales bacterium]
MKKKTALGIAGIMMVSVMSGCTGVSSKYLPDVDYAKYVKLCEYKGVEAQAVIYEVSDDEVDMGVEESMYEYATYTPITDRNAKEGDYADIDYEVKIDGKVEEDYSGENEEIVIGEEYLYPEMEKALVGMKTGESKTVEVELTEEFADEEDVGKTASVKVTLNKISEENIPECNEAFVKEKTDYETMADYREAIKTGIAEEKEQEYKGGTISEIMDYLIEHSEFDGYPQELYEQCKENYDSNNEYYAAMYGMTLEGYEETFGLTEEIKEEEINYNVNYELVIGAIAEKEGIDCTETEIMDYVESIYELYGYESAEAFLTDYSEEEVGYQVVLEKVTEFLYENAKKAEISEEEYLEQMEEEMLEDEFDEEDEEEIIGIEGEEQDEADEETEEE